MLIVLRDPHASIWEQNPALELVTVFKKFKADEGEERSSNILKAIYYIWDPKSELRDSGIDEKELMLDINENLLGDPNFDWDSYQEIKDYYLENNITEAEGLLLMYKKEIEGLAKLLKKWKWTEEDALSRAKVVSTYDTLFENYLKTKELVDIEHENSSEMLGGYTKSKFEQYGTDY